MNHSPLPLNSIKVIVYFELWLTIVTGGGAQSEPMHSPGEYRKTRNDDRSMTYSNCTECTLTLRYEDISYSYLLLAYL